MTVKQLKTDTKAIKLSVKVVNDLTVQIIPQQKEGFLLPTSQVCKGYGVHSSTIRRHLKDHSDELTQGIHYLKGVSITHTPKKLQPHGVYWTKEGIIRLGFFIKSPQAKVFRDWAESVILNEVDDRSASQLDLYGKPVSRKIKSPVRRSRFNKQVSKEILVNLVQVKDDKIRMNLLTSIFPDLIN